MRRALAALLAALLLAAAPARALTSANVGTAVADFLTIGAGARSLGMGGAYTAIAQGPEAIYWNPAGLAALTGPEATYSLTQLPGGIMHDYAAAGAPLPWLGGDVGVAFTELSQPGLDLVTASNQTVGSFAPHSDALALAYARRFDFDGNEGQGKPLDLSREWSQLGADKPLADDAPDSPFTSFAGRLDVGLSIKYIDENLGTRAAGTYAVDAGAVLRPAALPNLAVGAALRNVGGQLHFIDVNEPLPAELGASVAYAIVGGDWRLLPALDISLPYAGVPYAKLGVELSRDVGDGARASVRLGYSSQDASSLGALSGLTAGVGLRVSRFLFDAAFEPMSSLGDEYRLSVGWRF
jgi:hypothetical protein